MRDIKFRAWDKLEKRMRKVVSLHWQGDKLVSAKLEGENEPIPIEGRLEIEQYAEPILADRLICENDIVVDNLSLNAHRGEIAYLVTLEAGAFWYKPLRRLKGSGDFSRDSKLTAYEHIHYKTIGNIHENPELLEEI